MSWDGIRIDFGKINGWKFISILLTVIIVFYMWTGNSLANELEDSYTTISEYQKDSVTFERTINELGQEVITQKSLVVTTTKKIQQVLLVNSSLKSLNHQIKVQSNTAINNIKAKYYSNKSNDKAINYTIDSTGQTIDEDNFVLDTIKVNDKDYVAIGTMFNSGDQWYNLQGTIGKFGVSIDSLSIMNKQEVNIGCGKRKNIFAPRPLEVEVINKNPYTQTIAMKNVYIKTPKKKFYQTKAFMFATGIVGGIVLVHYIR